MISCLSTTRSSLLSSFGTSVGMCTLVITIVVCTLTLDCNLISKQLVSTCVEVTIAAALGDVKH